MQPIPVLNLEHRRLISQGADFYVFRLSVSAPKLAPKTADRIETWKRVPKRKLKRSVPNYFIETDATGRQRFVPTWEDNYRLALIDKLPHELIASKAVEQWR